MSTPTLTVARLSATVQLDRARDKPADAQRVGTVQQRVARDGLAQAWSQVTLPAGHWCIRRLAVPLEMNLSCPDSSLARLWSDAIMASVSRLLRDRPADDVVHYRHDLDALADAVAELAAGHHERAWAWAQAGVLQPGDPAISAMPGPVICAILGRRPELAVAVLAEAARRRGVTALDRALGRSGWPQVAQLAWAASSGTHLPSPAAAPATGHIPGLLATSVLAAEIARSRLSPAKPTRHAWAALVALEVDASLPRRGGASHLLAAVDTELARLLPERTGGAGAPGLPGPAGRRGEEADSARNGHSTDGPARPDAADHPMRASGPHPLAAADTGLARLLPRHRAARGEDENPLGAVGPAARHGDPAGPVRNGSTGGPTQPDADRERPAGSGQQGTARRQLHDFGAARGAVSGRPAGMAPPPADDLVATTSGLLPPPEPAAGLAPAGVPTSFAGLPFLLATAADAGVPERLLDDPALALRTLRWCVYAVARLMTDAPADDPGLLALTGLDISRAAALLAAPPASDAELARLNPAARDWALVTVARLVAASADPAADGLDPAPGSDDLLARVVRRRGHVIAQPGWIEVHLPIELTDLAVRRAGLDVDPGWVGWLGTAVRYVYA